MLTSASSSDTLRQKKDKAMAKKTTKRFRLCYKIADDKNSSEWREIVVYGKDAFDAVNSMKERFAKRSSGSGITLSELTCVPMRDPKPGRPKKETA